MVATPDASWLEFGLKPSADGWLSSDVELLNRLTRDGSLGRGAWLFWLKRDARSLRTWAIWSACIASLGFGVFWRDPAGIVIGLVVAAFYLRLLSGMATMWGGGRLMTGVVRALEPHPMASVVTALLEDQPTRVVMNKKTAEVAQARLGRFEVLFFEEKDPKAYALELAFRPVRDVSPRVTPE